jgi:DNA polymerase
MKVHIDFETRSCVELPDTGVHIYAEDPTTDVWCMAYALGDGPVQGWLPFEEAPEDLMIAIQGGAELHAWNAQFERIIWREIMVPRYGWPELDLERWHCTMAAGYAMGLPGSLDMAGHALRAGITKDKEGHALMMRMCRPRKVNPDGSIVWWDDAERVARLLAYCKRDVAVERMISGTILPLSKRERQTYLMDQRINDRGIRVDLPLVKTSIAISEAAKDKLNKQMRQATGGLVPKCSSVQKLIPFMQDRGVDISSVAKTTLAEKLDNAEVSDALPEVVHRVLWLRREYAKTSVEKLPTLLSGTSWDSRIRGLLQYHGASTGRWTGRRFQPQNLMRPTMKFKQIMTAIGVIMSMAGDPADLRPLEYLYGNPMSVLADIVRSTLIASPGAQLYSADYSNIEGRVTAWLAGEEWKLDAFKAFDAGTGPTCTSWPTPAPSG